MTQQYQQGDINLLDGDPVTFITQGVTPLAVTIDQITVDGEALMVQMFGGGVDPASVLANNYTCLFRVMFTRTAGIIAATSIRSNVVGTGVPIAIVPLVGTVNAVQFLVTIGGGFTTPYNHQWKISKLRF